MDLVPFAAIVFAALTAVTIGFQLALAAGAPWGEFAMGGTYPGRYPPRMRAAAVVMALLLVGIGGVVLARAGLTLPSWAGTARWLVWGIVAFTALGTVMNLATPSVKERRVWAPVTAVLFVCALVVALSPVG